MTASTSDRKYGPPESGYHAANDTHTDAAGTIYLCIEGGYPGKWVVSQSPVDQSNETTLDSVNVKSKYTLAVVERVHMKADTGLAELTEIDVEGFDPESPTFEEDLTAAGCELANALKAALLAHMADVGSTTVDGAHKAADETNDSTLAAITDADDEASLITLISGLLTAINAHRDETGVHFNDDAEAVTITTDPPTDFEECAADANDLFNAFVAHFALASE